MLFSCEMKKTGLQKWDFYEASFESEYSGNPFMDVDFSAVFTNETDSFFVRGFYKGENQFALRFMPHQTGLWSYETRSNVEELDGIRGSFNCVEPAEDNHGPVEVYNRYYLRYADGAPYYQAGTTAYAWIHQGDSMGDVTMETLKASPFNKIRMCVFPKDYRFSVNEPELHVFEKDSAGDFDFSRFNTKYFENLEKRLLQLRDAGIEADLILFHPYDRWGYQLMPDSTDQFYLEYLIARVGAFRNVWWSAANEFDFMENKSMDDWDRFFEIIVNEDPYHKLRSIHNGAVMYDHSKAWITHASIQSTHFDSAAVWKERWKKPLIYDECRYEGDVEYGWGNLSPEEMTAMFWRSLITGTYAGHGETYEHPEDILWWSKGGVFHGESPERIAFFSGFLRDVPSGGYDIFGKNYGGRHEEQYFWYFDSLSPDIYEFALPENILFSAEIIDTWNMEVSRPDKLFTGNSMLDLPGKKYIAIRFTAERLLFPVKPINFDAFGNTFIDELSVGFLHPSPEKIRYTLDGSEPTENSLIYEGKIIIDREVTLKAAVFDAGRKSETVSRTYERVSPRDPVEPGKPVQGLEWKSYAGNWEVLPDFGRLKPVARGNTPEISLEMAPSKDYFGMVYAGYVKVPEDDVYTFHAVSDDGSAVYVDGETVVLNDGIHGIREEEGQIALKKGFHELEIHFFDNWYDEFLEIYISGTKTKRTRLKGEWIWREEN
jgi:hypothetical protein